MKESELVKQWGSNKRDSVFISEELLYYGTFHSKNCKAPNPEDLNKLGSIPLSYFKSFQIDRKKKTTTLEYGKHSDLTILIRWESIESINEFKHFLLNRFPGSHVLAREHKVKSKTKGAVAALIIIPIIYLIVLLTKTDKPYYSGSRRFGEAIIAMFQALSSMGVLMLTILFGSLFLVALLSLFHARKRSADITMIQLR